MFVIAPREFQLLNQVTLQIIIHILVQSDRIESYSEIELYKLIDFDIGLISNVNVFF